MYVFMYEANSDNNCKALFEISNQRRCLRWVKWC